MQNNEIVEGKVVIRGCLFYIKIEGRNDAMKDKHALSSRSSCSTIQREKLSRTIIFSFGVVLSIGTLAFLGFHRMKQR